MHPRIILTTGLSLALAFGFNPAASQEYPPDPWLQGEQRGYLIALCDMERAGIITSAQSTEFLRTYAELTDEFDAKYLEGVLMNYIGLKRCSFSTRVVGENQPLLP